MIKENRQPPNRKDTLSGRIDRRPTKGTRDAYRDAAYPIIPEDNAL